MNLFEALSASGRLRQRAAEQVRLAQIGRGLLAALRVCGAARDDPRQRLASLGVPTRTFEGPTALENIKRHLQRGQILSSPKATPALFCGGRKSRNVAPTRAP